MVSLSCSQSQTIQLALLQSSPLPSSITDLLPSSSSSSDVNPAQAGPTLSSSAERIIELAGKIIDADFSSVLLSEEARAVLSDRERSGSRDLLDMVGIPLGWCHTGVEDANRMEEQGQEGDILDLIVAIGCLQSFVQSNWTGPDLTFHPVDLLLSRSPSTSSSTPSPTERDDLATRLHNSTIPLLSSAGEPAYHLCRDPTFLLLALRILNRLSARERREVTRAQAAEEEGRGRGQRLQSVDWWLLRAELVHQSILDEAVPLPKGLMQSVESLLDQSGSEDSTDASTAAYPPFPLDADALATLHTTLGLASFYTASTSSLSSDKLAQRHFLQAGRESGLEWELTGAMGKRTKFQVKEMSQLVLVARSRAREGEVEEELEVVHGEGEQASGRADSLEAIAGGTRSNGMPETLALNDDTLLEQTEYTSSSLAHPIDGRITLPDRLAGLNPQSQPALHPLDQSLILCMCLAQHNTSPENGLTASQMAPYLNRVISHPRNWSIHTTALLLRARLEAKRSRTVERSALQLQALVDQMPTADSKASERLKYFHQIPLPSRWEMEKELAQRFLSLGVVRSALEIFQRLEMWEEAVRCYVSMEESEKAVRVVRELLDGTKEEQDIKIERLKLDGREDMAPEGKERRRLRMDSTREAKLWCLLGDLEKDHAEEFYKKAWEISGHTSSRSQRSLGGLCLAREQYATAIPYFEAALKINPLYARTWFALGCCFVREERWVDAREAFSRNVAIEEEDGEAWNNLAAVYLRLDENANEVAKMARDPGTASEVDADDEREIEKSVPFENKRLAFRALQQGLRSSRENWRMWQNFMVVAVDVGEMSEAARALAQIVERQTRKDTSAAVDEAVLSKLVDAVTREDWNGGKGDRPEGQAMTSNEGFGLLPIVDRLFNEIILPKVSDTPKVFVIQARLMRWREDWSGALECYLRAWRCGPGQDEKVERDLALFKEVAIDLEELVDLMRNLGPRAHEQEVAAGLVKGKAKWSDWRFSARTLVRTFMGRTKDSFESEPEFERLKEVVAELRK